MKINEKPKNKLDLSAISSKSFTKFIETNYQQMLELCNDKQKFINFLNENYPNVHMSENYLNNFINKFSNCKNVTQRQFLVTNAYLAGCGLSAC